MAVMPPPSGELVGWDPIAEKAAWRVKYPVVDGGGVLATAGNLVLQGRADGIFAAYRATDGEQLWRFDAGTGIMAPPVTYTVDGVQYVTVMAGWGGAAGLMNTPVMGAVKPGWGRILTFALDGRAALKAPPFGHKDPPRPAITARQNPKAVHAGALLFNSHCFLCHGLNAVAGPLPDLRYSSKQVLDSFSSIVSGGTRASEGMPSFKEILSANDVKAIRAYVIARSQETAKPTQASRPR
jgi:quinohemoprotein ethanol dehydrogenase